ncbi:hypothetical protein HX063_16115 [Myroides odoratimimus]|uniref:hypothetical protein n=1 Tax=Myroides odoratimimus TaxID=76832 RepID=UPI002577804B|nr:hypothetical protein [Myroides odoratimimus]MDM1496907.1 hypothetical protein [Myroides odoratimimus]MDM1529978.1 hypothetical protein [Myroides odoratimimus]
MKKLIVLLTLLLPLLMTAQKENEYKSRFYIQTNFLGVDAGRDFLIGENIFVQTGVGIGAGYDVWNNSMSVAFTFKKPIPYLRGGLDWYYNKNKRIEKNRTLDNNSGNYVGFQAKYSFGTDSEEYMNSLNSVLVSEVHWGIKRKLVGPMYYKVQLGVGHFNDYDSKYSEVYPVVGVFLGATF